MKDIYKKLLLKLSSMTKEEIDADWELLKEYNEYGPTVKEYIDNLNI